MASLKDSSFFHLTDSEMFTIAFPWRFVSFMSAKTLFALLNLSLHYRPFLKEVGVDDGLTEVPQTFSWTARDIWSFRLMLRNTNAKC